MAVQPTKKQLAEQLARINNPSANGAWLAGYVKSYLKLTRPQLAQRLATARAEITTWQHEYH